jgi:hypothetical protein
MPKYVFTWNFSIFGRASRPGCARWDRRWAVVAAGRRGDVVVGGGEDRPLPPHGPVRHFQALEGLRARHLVDDVAVDVDERRAIRLFTDDVGIPEFFVEGAGHR